MWSSVSPPSTSRVSLCMASASSGPSDTVVAPRRRSSSSAHVIGVEPADGRSAKTQAIRQAGKPDWRRPQGRGGSAVGPVQVVDRDHDRTLQRGPLQQAFQVLFAPDCY
jgi:hypothetical protein